MEQPPVFSCAMCGDEFSTPQQLELHRRENHPHAGVPPTPYPQLQLQERPTTDEYGEVF